MAYSKSRGSRKGRKGRTKVRSGKRTKTLRGGGGSPGRKFQGGGKF